MSPKLQLQHGGTKQWGASVFSEEDFFAFSPSANLVGVIEEGHDEFSAESVESSGLYALFVFTDDALFSLTN